MASVYLPRDCAEIVERMGKNWLYALIREEGGLRPVRKEMPGQTDLYRCTHCGARLPFAGYTPCKKCGSYQ
jgi:hypothetical protein